MVENHTAQELIQFIARQEKFKCSLMKTQLTVSDSVRSVTSNVHSNVLDI